MKKSLLLIAGMFALTAAAQETTEPAFVAEALDGKTITLQCASGETATNGYYMMINGTTLTAAANPGTNPYKWLVEYDPEEQGMILSAGGYYIGRVPNSATDANSKYFTLTQDKELAGRYRLYPNNDITSDDIQRYCLTATKFVNGTTIETISKFGGGGDNTANHWMQCDVRGNSAHITRWGSWANNSKWTYSVVESEKYYPVTSITQIVDGGKYLIAAYNFNWGSGENEDKRFLMFESNNNKFSKVVDITDAKSLIWTAHTSSMNTCNNTGHGHGSGKARIMSFSHGDQYMNFPADETVSEYATTETSTNLGNELELFEVPVPNGGNTNNHYFTIHYKKLTSSTFFDRCLMTTNTCQVGNGTVGAGSMGLFLDNRYKNTNYFLLWHVIETEDDLYKLAKGFLSGGFRQEDGVVFRHGYDRWNFSGNTDVEASIMATVEGMEGSNAPASSVDVNAYFAASAGEIHPNADTPEPGLFLKIKANNSGFLNQAIIYYNTGTGSNNSYQNISTIHPQHPYNEDKAILYYDNNTLLSYTSGYYLGIKNSLLHWLNESDLTEDGGNVGAPIYFVRNTAAANWEDIWQVLYANTVIDNSPYALTGGTSGNYWNLKPIAYSGHTNDPEYAKTGYATTRFYDWHVSVVRELPVEIGADGSGSFYAPVAVSFPNSVTVYAAKVSDLDIRFSIVDPGTVIAPGTPVILTGTPNTTVNATIDYNYQPSTEPAVLAETTTPTITFYGTSAVEKCPETTGMCTFKPTAGSTDDQNVTLTEVESGTCLPVHTMLMSMPDDCPLVSTGENGAKTVTLKLNQENYTTGIREIETDRTGNAADAIYDLQGRRLSAPARGINIINGKKILVK